MKKVILCSCLVAALLCCLIVPSFAANWFGGTSEVVGSYTIVRNVGTSTTDVTSYAAWLYAAGATSAANSLGDFSYWRSSSDTEVRTGSLWSPDGVHVCESAYSSGTTYIGGLYSLRSTTIDSSAGYEQALLIPDCTVTPTMVTVGTSGFVSTGFSSALGIAGNVVDFCTSNTYVLIAIGLAVGVPLVGWGISKLKSLIKGY